MRYAFAGGVTVLLSVASWSNPVGADGMYASGTDYHGGYCHLMRRSSILDLPTVDDMWAAVEMRYHRAVDTSLSEATIFSRSPRFAWASEAKLACGKALGYFKGREINEEMVSKCDCYHGRMLAHSGR